MSASLLKKVSQNRTKLQQNNKQPFFLPKINKVFMSLILQNLKGRSVLDNFFENDPLDEPKRMLLSKKFCLFRKLVKNAKCKWWSKSNLPPSHSPEDRKMLPFKNGFRSLVHVILVLARYKVQAIRPFDSRRFFDDNELRFLPIGFKIPKNFVWRRFVS